MARYKARRGFLTDRVVAFERRCIIRIMRRTRGSVTKAAKLAQRNRTEFYRLLNYHQLKPSDFKVSGHESQELDDSDLDILPQNDYADGLDLDYA